MSTVFFFAMIAVFAALVGFALGPRGASQKRPILGGGISLLCYAIAIGFTILAILAFADMF